MIGEQTETSDKARHTPWMVETGRKVEITACDNHDCRGRIDRLRHSIALGIETKEKTVITVRTAPAWMSEPRLAKWREGRPYGTIGTRSRSE